MNPYNWVPALNTKLPATIRVMAAEQVTADFHARFSATAKTYEYRICTDPVLPPLLAGLAWHLPRLLDADLLATALTSFTGSHDFRGFAANRGNEDESTCWQREISAANFIALDDGYLVRISGDGFLYKMVRMLVGGAVHCAQGRIRIEDLAQLLDQPVHLPFGKSPICAPADGLTLAKVAYS